MRIQMVVGAFSWLSVSACASVADHPVGPSVTPSDTIAVSPNPASPNPVEMVIWTPGVSIQRIAAPNGVYRIEPIAFNDKGEVAGSFRYSAGATAPTKAFVWSPARGFVELFPGSFEISTATGINNKGTVAGVVAPYSSSSRAFTWSESTGIVWLANPPYASIFVTSISELGHVSGTMGGMPFLWAPERGYTLYKGAGNSQWWGDSSYPSGAIDVNDHDDILATYNGRYEDGRDYAWSWPSYPTIWQQGVNSDIDCASCVLSAMNNNREVVGIAWRPELRAFKWTRDRGVEVLPIADGNASKAYAINDAGTVAGSVVTGKGFEVEHAAIWTRLGVTVIDDIPGGRSTVGRDINNIGQVLVYVR